MMINLCTAYISSRLSDTLLGIYPGQLFANTRRNSSVASKEVSDKWTFDCGAGFDVRNFVAIAFCAVWLIVDSVLALGVYRVSRHCR